LVAQALRIGFGLNPASPELDPAMKTMVIQTIVLLHSLYAETINRWRERLFGGPRSGKNSKVFDFI
jgi:hypothetical protein